MTEVYKVPGQESGKLNGHGVSRSSLDEADHGYNRLADLRREDIVLHEKYVKIEKIPTREAPHNPR